MNMIIRLMEESDLLNLHQSFCVEQGWSGHSVERFKQYETCINDDDLVIYLSNTLCFLFDEYYAKIKRS